MPLLVDGPSCYRRWCCFPPDHLCFYRASTSAPAFDQRTSDWRRIREGRLTASNFSNALGAWFRTDGRTKARRGSDWNQADRSGCRSALRGCSGGDRCRRACSAPAAAAPAAPRRSLR